MKSKNKFFTRLAILFIAAFSLTLSSCKKKEATDEPIVITETGTMLLHLHNYIDATDIGELPNLSNPDDNGREITITKANLYITDIQLVKLDGTVYSFSGKKILKTFENVLYTIGDVPVGNYTTVKFKIGLDAATNAMQPTSSPDSIILNRSDMWYGPAAQPEGYVFFNFQGTIDTSSSLTEAQVPFSYKIGTNANLAQVTIPGINVSILKDQAAVAHMVADYTELFSGVQLNDVGNLIIATPADNSSTIAARLVSNIPNMFKPE